ncbi:hypothetical protein OG978_32355 [Streptomyces sp. NBC_01591]|uniref:hypothetical protein n=1 Tax=Streptomyces sp. NBC_01591 TaxID=2975888 RepID=UPI002DD84016|nr:hypothetical protein [Streptomyces sp. NBC_01591]WSD71666.1 hypothetical protein OG978_32355 [Streptomyces sp. NBC_01591]
MSAPMTPEQREAIAKQLGDVKPAMDGLLVSVAESVANVRDHDHPKWEDLYCMNLSSYMGERMAPVLRRLLNAEARVERSGRARLLAEHETRTVARERDVLRARVEELVTGQAPPEALSPWERAVAGLNALVDADVIFHVEPDGHISAPFSDEHIEWDLKARRWVLTHDDEDPCRPCGCPKRFNRHAEGCPTLECPSCAAPADEAGARIPEHRTGCPREEDSYERVVADYLSTPYTVDTTPAEDAHDSPLLPGACDACGDVPEKWCPDCAACRQGCHGGHDGNPCSHPNTPWGGAS